MTTLTISLSDSQKEFVEAQAVAGGFASASAYIAKLVEQAEIKKERDRINALLLEGLNSGPATPMTKQDWEDIRREVLGELAKPNRKPARKQKQK